MALAADNQQHAYTASVAGYRGEILALTKPTIWIHWFTPQASTLAPFKFFRSSVSMRELQAYLAYAEGCGAY